MTGSEKARAVNRLRKQLENVRHAIRNATNAGLTGSLSQWEQWNTSTLEYEAHLTRMVTRYEESE